MSRAAPACAGAPFAVDFVSVGSIPGHGMIDSYPLEWEESLEKALAMEPR